MEANLNGEVLEEMTSFKYLKATEVVNWRVESNVSNRVNEGCKLLRIVNKTKTNREMGMKVKSWMYEIIIPAVVYKSELWGMKVTEIESECAWNERFEEYGKCRSIHS